MAKRCALLLVVLLVLSPMTLFAASEEPVIDISPIFEGWIQNDDGTYNLYFGYENRSTLGGEPYVVTAEDSITNKLTPDTYSELLPTEFGFPGVVEGRPGRTGFGIHETNAFVIENWDGVGNIVWSLAGSTATASINPDKEFKPVIDISPIFEGWVEHEDGTYSAYFGYENRSTRAGQPYEVDVARDDISNFITPDTHQELLPTEFGFPNVVEGRPGRTGFGVHETNAFVIHDWDGSNIVWNLNGRTATAGLAGTELTLPEEPEDPEEPADPQDPKESADEQEDPVIEDDEKEELPKTGTNVMWLLPVGVGAALVGLRKLSKK
ncbi:MAG: hypothetical protein FH749_06425 [Firmicutes bacterium]|nr:hypothetical protein [Bacillota bacterium]